MSHVYEGEKFERATSRASLARRLEVNKAYGSADFDGWLMDRLDARPGEDVLDVGCGTGAQTLLLAARVGPDGSVSTIDISADSIAALREKLPPGARVQAEIADMAELDRIIREVFSVRRYDLAQSTYALYYANERAEVLATMKAALKPGGRLAVFTPNAPHGLVDLAARFGEVPQAVFDSLSFGPDVLHGWFRANLADVAVHHFHNDIAIPTVDEALGFYRATTYYDSRAEPAMRAAIEEQIARKGRFTYEKNGYLIVGRNDA